MSARVLIVLATVCLAGTQVGSGLAWLAASQLSLRRPVRPLRDIEPAALPHADGVLAGGLFAALEPSPPVPPPEGESGVRCAVPWRMVGSLIDRRVPERTFASLHTPEGGRLLGVGQTHDGLTLVEIERSSIVLSAEGGARCRVSMFDEAHPTLASEPTPPSRGMTRLSSSHVAVDRALLDDPSVLPSRMRALPHMVGGEMVGVRLYGIRAGDPLHIVGARNGDLLRAVDGEAMSDPNVALAAYGRLRSGEAVRVAIERSGETLETTLQAN